MEFEFFIVKRDYVGPGRNRISVSHAAIHNTNHISTELIRTSSTTFSNVLKNFLFILA